MSHSFRQNFLRAKPTRSAAFSQENILTVLSKFLGTRAKPQMQVEVLQTLVGIGEAN
jgi:hypothetical protein